MGTPSQRRLEQMYTDVEVARMLGVSKDTVRRNVKRGLITPIYKIGAAMRIPQSAVDRFLAGKEVKHG